MSKKIVEEINKLVCLQKESNELLKVKIDIMDRRSEANYMMICQVADKFKCLEEYLKIEFQDDVVINNKKYKKTNEK